MYGYRDVWPLLTYTLTPADSSEGSTLWAKIGLFAIAGLAIPLIIPRAYVPLNAQVRPAGWDAYRYTDAQGGTLAQALLESRTDMLAVVLTDI